MAEWLKAATEIAVIAIDAMALAAIVAGTSGGRRRIVSPALPGHPP